MFVFERKQKLKKLRTKVINTMFKTTSRQQREENNQHSEVPDNEEVILFWKNINENENENLKHL